MELLYRVVLQWHKQERQHKKRQQAKQTGVAHFVSKPGHFPDHHGDLHCQKATGNKASDFFWS